MGGADLPLLRPVFADVHQAVFDLLQEGEDVARRAAGEVKEGRPQRASRLPVAVGHVPDLPGGLHDRRPLQNLAVAGESRLPRVPVAVHVPEDGPLVDLRRLELVEEPALPRA